MTKKDYIILAEALARTRPEKDGPCPLPGCGEPKSSGLHAPASECRGCMAPNDHHEYDPGRTDYWSQWSVTRDALIGALMLDNPAFNRIRFINATEA